MGEEKSQWDYLSCSLLRLLSHFYVTAPSLLYCVWIIETPYLEGTWPTVKSQGHTQQCKVLKGPISQARH